MPALSSALGLFHRAERSGKASEGWRQRRDEGLKRGEQADEEGAEQR